MIRLIDLLKEVTLTPGKHIKQEALELINFLNKNKDLQKLKAKINIHGSLNSKDNSDNDIDIALWEDEFNSYGEMMTAINSLSSERAKQSSNPAVEVVIEQLEKLGFKQIKEMKFPQGDIIVIRFENDTNNRIELWFASPY